MLVITLVLSSEISALPTSFLRYDPKILVGSADIEDSLNIDQYRFTRHALIYNQISAVKYPPLSQAFSESDLTDERPSVLLNLHGPRQFVVLQMSLRWPPGTMRFHPTFRVFYVHHQLLSGLTTHRIHIIFGVHTKDTCYREVGGPPSLLGIAAAIRSDVLVEVVRRGGTGTSVNCRRTEHTFRRSARAVAATSHGRGSTGERARGGIVE